MQLMGFKAVLEMSVYSLFKNVMLDDLTLSNPWFAEMFAIMQKGSFSDCTTVMSYYVHLLRLSYFSKVRYLLMAGVRYLLIDGQIVLSEKTPSYVGKDPFLNTAGW